MGVWGKLENNMDVKGVVKVMLQWTYLLLFRIVGVITGIVVAIATPFRVEDVGGNEGEVGGS